MADYRPLQRCSQCNLPVIPGERVFGLGGTWHLACVPNFVRLALLEIDTNRPELIQDLIEEIHEEFGLRLHFLEELVEEAARASGSGAYAGPVYDDETIVIEIGEPIAIEDDEPIVIEDDEPIVIEDDEPLVGTKENPIVIKDDK